MIAQLSDRTESILDSGLPMRMRSTVGLGILLVLGIVLAKALAIGADAGWPVRPVRLVVPFSPSGTADLLARLVAEKLGSALGQPFVVEDRPGAGGMIGAEAVARSAPDGHTLVVSSFGSFVVSPAFNPPPFDPFRDFTHIAYLGGQPAVLIANKDLPQKSLADMVAEAKAKPGAINYATISIGSNTQLLTEMLQKQAGIRLSHIPYRGAGQIVTDVLAGHLHLGSIALTAAAGSVKSGAVRALAVSTERRLAGYPEVPTFREQGYPELVSSTWFALSGPANLPGSVVNRLNAEVVKALAMPDVIARLENESIDTKTLDAEAFTAFFKAEAERWLPLARAVAAQAKSDRQ
jgi:tripartite-type tricarboxylate transporter receptor subunit TctC